MSLSHSSWRKRGSSLSLSQSPNKFSDMTVSIMATPGKVDIHQTPPANLSRPSETIDPQAGVGGGTPAPKKLRVDSKRITIPTWRVATTINVLIVPGNMCMNKIRAVDAPETLARDT